MRYSYRPGTQRNYKSRARGYYHFCQFYELEMFPATKWNLVRYVRCLANGVMSYGTVTGYLSTIKRLHQLGRYKFLTDTFQLELELMAIKHELAGPIKKAVPITPALLVRIFEKVGKTDVKQLVYFAVLVIGFCLFLRKSNLVPDTLTGFNVKEQLTCQVVWWYKHYMMIDVKWSKTLQYREKDLTLPLKLADNGIVCAVKWINWLLQFDGKGCDPLLAVPQMGRLTPITYDMLSKQLKCWVEMLGENPQDYTLHGLRRGGTNHALTVGICGEDVQLMGDWKSQAYIQYIDLTLDRRICNVVKFMDQVDEVVKDCV